MMSKFGFLIVAVIATLAMSACSSQQVNRSDYGGYTSYGEDACP